MVLLIARRSGGTAVAMRAQARSNPATALPTLITMSWASFAILDGSHRAKAWRAANAGKAKSGLLSRITDLQQMIRDLAKKTSRRKCINSAVDMNSSSKFSCYSRC